MDMQHASPTADDEAFAYWNVLGQILHAHQYEADHPSWVLAAKFSRCIVDLMSRNLVRTTKASLCASRLIEESHVTAPELTEEMRFLVHVARSVSL
jgi:hypothetical protein